MVDAAVKLRRVRMLVTIVLIGMLASIAFHYVGAFWRGWGVPRATFLFKPSDHLRDWENIYLYAKAYQHGQPTSLIYFPFAGLAIAAATLLPWRLGLALMILLFIVAMVMMLRRWVVDVEGHALVRVQYVFVLVALSYPVIFALDRANLELLMFIFLAGFFYFFYVRKPAWLAAVFLALAIAFKLYPAVFLLLMLAERRIKLLLLTIGLAVGLTAAGVAYLSLAGGYGLRTISGMIAHDQAAYQVLSVKLGGGVQHGHSLWGLIQATAFFRHTWSTPSHLETIGYTGLAVLLFLLIAVYVVFFEKERWKQVLLVTVSAILLPFVSCDYTLIHIYFPLVFFVNSPRVSRWNLIYVALFAVLLVPMDYVYAAQILDGISTSTIVYPLALIVLALLAVLDRSSPAASLSEGIELQG